MMKHLWPAALLLLLTTPADADPELRVGLGAGYSQHFGKWTEVDGQTGASSKVPDSEYTEHGLALSLFADLGLVALGSGDLGLFTAATVSLPEVYLALALAPRYRWSLGDFAPWAGLGVQVTQVEELGGDTYVGVPLLLGCDYALAEGLSAGLQLHLNVINPKGVERTVEGYEHKGRLDDVKALLGLSYQLF